MDNLDIKIVRSSDSSKFEFGATHDWVIAEDGLENFGSIENDVEFSDNISTDGGVINSTHITSVDRTIKAIYRYRTNMDVARKKLLAFFNIKDTFKVTVTYGKRNVYAEGILYKFHCETRSLENGYLSVSLTFMFASPFWKSVDDFGQNIAAVRGMIAFPYLASTEKLNVGATGGVYNFARQITLYNDGDIATRCRAEFVASDSVINPKLIINDQYVRVIDELAAGDEIVMDFSAIPPTVKKNGSNFLGHCDRTSAFSKMLLECGDNEIAYDADNGTSNLQVNIFYNKQYGAV